MESAAALMPPSTGLNYLLLFAETKYSWRTKYENTPLYQCMGESLTQYKDSWCEIKFSEKRTYQNSVNIHNLLNTCPGGFT